MKFFTAILLAAVARAGVISKRQSPFPGNPLNILSSFRKVAAKAPLKPFLEETLKAQQFPAAKRKQVVWGPYTIRAVKERHSKGEGGIKFDSHSDLIEYNLDGLCKECLILDARIDVTDKTGKKLPLSSEIYTHHIILSNVGTPGTMPPLTIASSCLSNTPVSEILKGLSGGFSQGFKIGDLGKIGGLLGGAFSGPKAASLSKRTAQSPPPRGNPSAGGLPFLGGLLPPNLGGANILLIKGHEANHVNWASYNGTGPKSGLWIGKDDKILNSVEVVNYKDVPQEVYFAIDAEYVDMKSKPADYLDVGFSVLNAMDCKDLAMNPPKDKPKTYVSPVYNITREAYLIDLHPHMHDGAMNMKLYRNEKLVCDRQAIYGSGSGGPKLNDELWETIERYTPCDTIALKAGDKIKMTSDYDLTKHRLRPSSADHHMGTESMALAFVQFAYGRK